MPIAWARSVELELWTPGASNMVPLGTVMDLHRRGVKVDMKAAAKVAGVSVDALTDAWSKRVATHRAEAARCDELAGRYDAAGQLFRLYDALESQQSLDISWANRADSGAGESGEDVISMQEAIGHGAEFYARLHGASTVLELFAGILAQEDLGELFEWASTQADAAGEVLAKLPKKHGSTLDVVAGISLRRGCVQVRMSHPWLPTMTAEYVPRVGNVAPSYYQATPSFVFKWSRPVFVATMAVGATAARAGAACFTVLGGHKKAGSEASTAPSTPRTYPRAACPPQPRFPRCLSTHGPDEIGRSLRAKQVAAGLERMVHSTSACTEMAGNFIEVLGGHDNGEARNWFYRSPPK